MGHSDFIDRVALARYLLWRLFKFLLPEAHNLSSYIFGTGCPLILILKGKAHLDTGRWGLFYYWASCPIVLAWFFLKADPKKEMGT